ncbi:MAG: sulfur carrier protein ThiS [Verrucomicrobia bacterium]|nr:MAG: sulfur carrier protein ThiS [Verrucomicrobiota bacterium]
MTDEATITVTANGREYRIPKNQLLDTFLESVGQKPGLVVVERNGIALTQSEARKTVLEHGDRLEIVRIVAGG